MNELWGESEKQLFNHMTAQLYTQAYIEETGPVEEELYGCLRSLVAEHPQITASTLQAPLTDFRILRAVGERLKPLQKIIGDIEAIRVRKVSMVGRQVNHEVPPVTGLSHGATWSARGQMNAASSQIFDNVKSPSQACTQCLVVHEIIDGAEVFCINCPKGCRGRVYRTNPCTKCKYRVNGLDAFGFNDVLAAISSSSKTKAGYPARQFGPAQTVSLVTPGHAGHPISLTTPGSTSPSTPPRPQSEFVRKNDGQTTTDPLSKAITLCDDLSSPQSSRLRRSESNTSPIDYSLVGLQPNSEGVYVIPPTPLSELDQSDSFWYVNDSSLGAVLPILFGVKIMFVKSRLSSNDSLSFPRKFFENAGADVLPDYLPPTGRWSIDPDVIVLTDQARSFKSRKHVVLNIAWIDDISEKYSFDGPSDERFLSTYSLPYMGDTQALRFWAFVEAKRADAYRSRPHAPRVRIAVNETIGSGRTPDEGVASEAAESPSVEGRKRSRTQADRGRSVEGNIDKRAKKKRAAPASLRRKKGDERDSKGEISSTAHSDPPRRTRGKAGVKTSLKPAPKPQRSRRSVK